MDLCTLGMNRGEIVELITVDFPELRALETLGFVVSTETYDSIRIRVNGHIYSNDGQHFFCIKEGKHG